MEFSLHEPGTRVERTNAMPRAAAGIPASSEHGKAVYGRWRLVAQRAGNPATSFRAAERSRLQGREWGCGDVLSAVKGQNCFFRAMFLTPIKGLKGC